MMCVEVGAAISWWAANDQSRCHSSSSVSHWCSPARQYFTHSSLHNNSNSTFNGPVSRTTRVSPGRPRVSRYQKKNSHSLTLCRLVFVVIIQHL